MAFLLVSWSRSPYSSSQGTIRFHLGIAVHSSNIIAIEDRYVSYIQKEGKGRRNCLGGENVFLFFFLFYSPPRPRAFILYLYSFKVWSAAPQTTLWGGPRPRYEPEVNVTMQRLLQRFAECPSHNASFVGVRTWLYQFMLRSFNVIKTGFIPESYAPKTSS